MSRFTKGMKAGAAPFEKISRDSAECIREATSATRKDIDSLRYSLNNIIDIIAEDDPKNRERLISTLQDYQKNNKRPASYKIQIVYSKDYSDMANDLRETLNKQGNAASMQSIEDYKTNNCIADYYIMLGQYSTETGVEHLLDVAGCQIDLLNKHIYVYEKHIGDIIDGLTDSEWEKFVDYYASVTNKVLMQEKEFQKANKIRKKKRRRKDTRIANKMMDMADWLSDTPFDLLLTDNILVALAGFPVSVAAFLTSFSTLILSIPVSLSEVLINGLLNSLETRDSKAVKQAQRQILLIKTCEYISKLQVLNSK